MDTFKIWHIYRTFYLISQIFQCSDCANLSLNVLGNIYLHFWLVMHYILVLWGFNFRTFVVGFLKDFVYLYYWLLILGHHVCNLSVYAIFTQLMGEIFACRHHNCKIREALFFTINPSSSRFLRFFNDFVFILL